MADDVWERKSLHCPVCLSTELRLGRAPLNAVSVTYKCKSCSLLFSVDRGQLMRHGVPVPPLGSSPRDFTRDDERPVETRAGQIRISVTNGCFERDRSRNRSRSRKGQARG
jgi:transposase-like protein